MFEIKFCEYVTKTDHSEMLFSLVMEIFILVNGILFQIMLMW